MLLIAQLQLKKLSIDWYLEMKIQSQTLAAAAVKTSAFTVVGSNAMGIAPTKVFSATVRAAAYREILSTMPSFQPAIHEVLVEVGLDPVLRHLVGFRAPLGIVRESTLAR